MAEYFKQVIEEIERPMREAQKAFDDLRSAALAAEHCGGQLRASADEAVRAFNDATKAQNDLLKMFDDANESMNIFKDVAPHPE